ncbi:PREDICTED: adenylate kinase isoenzyme 6-like [Acromyrmex echinatior]|uniref:Adenylate kinase isoenzyme 6 homolog n=1 Tax=Acromyrmex echinatior TaxID=103372 RepID=F4WP18_ACREC|nr:PREDICTED: adenylate kinase isoenzyme 6-like [Acromyrmex echinatior]EGI63949.1 Adenylate kinase isoenzyme 6 [Acromyrmex echinatior]
MNMRRSAPNILICGTPGVGKSLMAHLLEEETKLNWIDVSKVAIETGCVKEYDEELQCSVLDEDALLKLMENWMRKGGQIVDYHSADLFPVSWFDIVFVLRTNNTILYDRLKERGYNKKKLQSNVEAEIFEIVVQEAKDSFEPEIVHELTNDTPDELIVNVDRICQWIEQWKTDNK